jgi:hypothetical protein
MSHVSRTATAELADTRAEYRIKVKDFNGVSAVPQTQSQPNLGPSLCHSEGFRAAAGLDGASFATDIPAAPSDWR